MMGKRRLLVVSFLTGLCVMTLELLASRILAPYVGSSNLVWTMIIGVVMASLSLGYTLGGRLADRDPQPKKVGQFLLVAALLVAILPWWETFLLVWCSQYLAPMLAVVIGAVVLFAPPSFCLAAVSPFLVRLANRNLKQLGQISGQLSAANSWGSIVGTFATGLLFFPWLGSHRTLLLLVIVLISLAMLMIEHDQEKRLLKVGVGALVILVSGWGMFRFFHSEIIADLDTQYSRFWVTRTSDEFGNVYQSLATNGGLQSAIKEGDQDYLFTYLQYFNLWQSFKPGATKIALVGGAGMVYPSYFARHNPEKSLEVIEIDEQMPQIAAKYFGYQPHERVSVQVQDGRVFLANQPNEYDVLLIDAFQERVVPLNLVTREAVTIYRQALKNDRGVVLMNVIGSLSAGGTSDFASVIKTFKQVFPAVEVWQMNPRTPLEQLQNYMLVASTQEITWQEELVSDRHLAMLETKVDNVPWQQGHILTDDQAIYDLPFLSLIGW